MTTIFRLLQEVDNNTTVNDAETPPAASPGMDGVAVATGTESASGTSAAMALAATMCPEVSGQMASCMNTTCTEAETACINETGEEDQFAGMDFTNPSTINCDDLQVQFCAVSAASTQCCPSCESEFKSFESCVVGSILTGFCPDLSCGAAAASSSGSVAFRFTSGAMLLLLVTTTIIMMMGMPVL